MNKKIIFLIVLISIVGFGLGISHFSHAASTANTTYTPMEKIPGMASGAVEFPAYVKAVYKFGIWAIGICALLMIMIGGFMYMTSAGNNATMGKAKGYITDALIGLAMAMTAWLLLNTINPDLVNIKIKFPSGSSSGTSSSGTSAATAAQNAEDCKKYCEAGGSDSSIKYDDCYSTCMTAKTAASTSSGGRVSTKASCSNLSDSTYASEVKSASEKYGVPESVLNSFIQRECTSAFTNSFGGCVSSNNSINGKNGGAMQFDDTTWSTYGCSGSKFNRQDALNCGAKKIAKDSGGDYSEEGIRKAAKAYCGSCNDSACGGSYCDGIMSNYDVYSKC
ncbi:MAG: pilin [Parcubacteria group bacterium]|jgi:hypothetical protein